MQRLLIGLLLVGISLHTQAQSASEYDGGYKITFNEDGSKYLNTTLYSQFRFVDYEGDHARDGFMIRRARIRMYAELGDQLFIMANVGLNSLNAEGLSPTGKSKENSIKLMEMVIQYRLAPHFHLGAGLHFWNGISRLNSSSSMNSMTLDNNRGSISTMGMTNQLGMNLGVYGKGRFDKINYRLAINDAAVNTLDGGRETVMKEGEEKYLGKALLNKGRYVYEGYFSYEFLDSESNLLPYFATTYLGAKSIFNIGAGFSIHPNGVAKNDAMVIKTKNANHFAVDAFYDAPVGHSNASLSVYTAYQYSQLGDAYSYSTVVGNGSQYYAHLGYMIPKHIKEGVSPYKNRIQPYVSYSHRAFKNLDEPAKELRFGGNWFVDGRNAKLTIEYQKRIGNIKTQDDVFAIQAMIYL